MGKYLENWLTFWKEEEASGMVYDRSHKDLLNIYKERYEIISVDPFPDRTVLLMRAYAYASKHRLSIPTWVIEGLDSNENFRPCRFFTAASKEKHVDSNEAMERAGLKDHELAAKIFNDEIEWCIKLGNWLPEETQAVWRNRVKDDGLTWIDKEDMTYFLVLDNLDDVLFPESTIVKLEKGAESTTQEVIDDHMKELVPAIGSEIEPIYAAMKNIRLSSSTHELQDVAIESLDKHEHTFKYLKKEHLQDRAVFSLTLKQEKRDFFGALLQKIILERTKKKPPSMQDLFAYFKSTEKGK